MGFEPYHEEVELLAARGAPRGRGSSGGRERRGPRGDLRVDAWELVDGGGDAEAGDVRLQEALVERVRRDGRLLPLPPTPDAAAAGGHEARVDRRPDPGRGVHRQRVVRVVERHPPEPGSRLAAREPASCRRGLRRLVEATRARGGRGGGGGGPRGGDGERSQVAEALKRREEDATARGVCV